MQEEIYLTQHEIPVRARVGFKNIKGKISNKSTIENVCRKKNMNINQPNCRYYN